MDPEENNVEQEVKEIFNNIMTKGNIQLNKLYTGDISKGVITFLNKLICNYIKTYPNKEDKGDKENKGNKGYKGNNIFRFISFLSKKFAKRPLDNIYNYRNPKSNPVDLFNDIQKSNINKKFLKDRSFRKIFAHKKIVLSIKKNDSNAIQVIY